MQIFYGQKAANIIEGIDLVVYTAAIHEDNPEFAAAKEKGIPMLSPRRTARTDHGQLSAIPSQYPVPMEKQPQLP